MKRKTFKWKLYLLLSIDCSEGGTTPTGMEEWLLNTDIWVYGGSTGLSLGALMGEFKTLAAVDWLIIPFVILVKSSVSLLVSKDKPALNSWHRALTVSTAGSGCSGMGETLGRCGIVSMKLRCRSVLEGRSLILKDIWRLNGDCAPICEKPRKLPCLSSNEGVAWGRSIAKGL